MDVTGAPRLPWSPHHAIELLLSLLTSSQGARSREAVRRAARIERVLYHDRHTVSPCRGPVDSPVDERSMDVLGCERVVEHALCVSPK